jgi:hypothetical protein
MKELMIAVERAVRPIRASAGRKDRMREELLAHLTGLYDEELTRLGNGDAARAHALARFGNPADLTAELEASVAPRERIAIVLERWLGWRAPETAFRYNLRLVASLLLFSIIAALLVIVVDMALGHSADRIWIGLRVGGSLLLVLHIEVFLLGLLYFKTRDALCNRPPPSRRRALALALVAGLVTLAAGPAMALLALGDIAIGLDILRLWLPLAFLVPLGFALFGIFFGPAQIRHAEWCCLDIS